MTRAASRRTGRLLVFWAGLLVCLSVAVSARAGGGACGDAFKDWTAACSQRAGLAVSAAHCLPGGVVLSLAKAGTPLLDVEVDGAGARGFRHVAGLALSPVGELGDWSTVPQPKRDAFDALAACVEADPALPGVATTRTPRQGRVPPPAPLPWRALLGLALGVVIAWPAARRRPRAALALALASAALLALRWLALPHDFFHQNGHGPEWVETALYGGSLSDYGPGYAELFGLAARASAAAERGVFFEQALLAALAPACAFVVARRAGARDLVAGALALGVAVDPILNRTSVSESYFATGASLLFMAAAMLACGAVRARLRSPRFALGVAGAGLLVSEVARVHPLLWIGAACLPVVVAMGPGTLRARLVLAGVAALGVGAITAAFAGSTLLHVLGGSLGRTWMPAARGHLALALGAAVAGLAAIALLRFAPRRARRLLVPVACFGLVLGVARASNVLGAPSAAVAAAQARVFWPVLIACVAALLGRVATTRRRASALAAIIAVAGVAVAAALWRPMTTLPTDLLEQRFARQWRTSLPEHAQVLYLARVDKRIVSLPLYGGADAMPLRLSEPPPDPAQLGERVYYYRSSLCSSAEGAPFCAAIEHRARLERIAVRKLPARPSMRWDHYDHDAVTVALYRMTPR